tara:strand:+ start:8415 stop:10709 length:2295 start_codon:yes stop_codon:yes gene_type:complete
MFVLHSEYGTAGDQEQAISILIEQIKSKQERCVLMGVTGSGKTFAMANIIERLGIPTLILSHNKTLARQLWQEMSELFPENAVEYFVSYYDYYQPEAYLPNRDLYIDKELQMNERIEQERFSTVASLVTRPDVITVGTVSAIYGLNPPESFQESYLHLEVGDQKDPQEVMRALVDMQYRRTTGDIARGDVRLRGEVLDVWMPSRDDPIRIRFGWDGIEKITVCEAISWEPLDDFEEAWIHPKEFYMTSEERFTQAIEDIENELDKRIDFFISKGMDIEAHRIEQRTKFDLEMLREVGSCKGVENYSLHFDGREVGERPYCLLDFYRYCSEHFHGGADKYLVIMDESHVTLPQVGGMFGGDWSRKKNLVEHGFRLPSAHDNRPLKIKEFQEIIPQMLYVSATPGERELRHLCEITNQNIHDGLLHSPSKGGGGPADYDKKQGRWPMEEILSEIEGLVRMEIRPTGLLDPAISVRGTEGQIDDLLSEITKRTEVDERVLVTVMTIKFAEEVASYLQKMGIKAHYLHSEIDTIERTEIIKALRIGHIDVIVGINLLREGLDIPEVSLVAIFDADREGFLRNERSLLQTIGRASRNSNGEVILYADQMSSAMEAAIHQTLARRKRQEKFNAQNKITPKTIMKAKPIMGSEVEDLLAGAAGKGKKGGRRLVGKKPGKKGIEALVNKFGLGAGAWNSTDSVLENISQPEWVEAAYEVLDEDNVENIAINEGERTKLIERLEKEMKQAAARLDFERAASLRDRIFQIRTVE